MANIMVDYERLAKYSLEWKETGNTIYNDINSITNIFQQLNGTWYGPRFEDLMRSYEGDAMPLFQGLVNLVYTWVPYWAGSAAINYAKTQGKSVNAVSDQVEKKLELFAVKKVEGKFNISEEHVKESMPVIKKLKDEILELMQNIMNGLNDASAWDSPAAGQSRTLMKQYRENIEVAFDKMIENINNYMQLALDDINKAEQANNLNGQGTQAN